MFLFYRFADRGSHKVPAQLVEVSGKETLDILRFSLSVHQHLSVDELLLGSEEELFRRFLLLWFYPLLYVIC